MFYSLCCDGNGDPIITHTMDAGFLSEEKCYHHHKTHTYFMQPHSKLTFNVTKHP